MAAFNIFFTPVGNTALATDFNPETTPLSPCTYTALCRTALRAFLSSSAEVKHSKIIDLSISGFTKSSHTDKNSSLDAADRYLNLRSSAKCFNKVVDFAPKCPLAEIKS